MMIIDENSRDLLKEHMKEAYFEAQKAKAMGEVPVGAVVVYKNQIIVRAHNLVESSFDPTAHAEIIALRQAGQYLKTNKLTEIDLYVTLEPCQMCAGAVLLADINRLIFGAYDDKIGSVGSTNDIIRTPDYKTDIKVIGGILQKQCSTLIKDFFSNKR